MLTDRVAGEIHLTHRGGEDNGNERHSEQGVRSRVHSVGKFESAALFLSLPQTITYRTFCTADALTDSDGMLVKSRLRLGPRDQPTPGVPRAPSGRAAALPSFGVFVNAGFARDMSSTVDNW